MFIFVSVEIWLANFYSNNINNSRQYHDQEKERHWAAATMFWFIIMTQTQWMTAGKKKKVVYLQITPLLVPGKPFQIQIS